MCWGDDISYTHGTVFDEHNYEGIGLYDDEAGVYQSFNGHFDGKGYTISGNLARPRVKGGV